MAERLATWVWVGASALALVAGMVNVVGYLGFEHQAITHLTGTTTLLGAALAGARWTGAMELAAMAGAFVAGAALSGLLVQDATLRLGRRYGVALAIEAEAAGNVKRTWVNHARARDWMGPAGEGRPFLRAATEVKTIWVPYGE